MQVTAWAVTHHQHHRLIQHMPRHSGVEADDLSVIIAQQDNFVQYAAVVLRTSPSRVGARLPDSKRSYMTKGHTRWVTAQAVTHPG